MRTVFRKLPLFAAGVAVGMVLLWALCPSPPPTIPASQSSAEAALDRVIDEVRFQGTPLATVLAELERKSGVKISAGWQATASGWNDPSIKPSLDAPMVLHRRGLSLYDLLRQIFDEFNLDTAIWIEPAGDEIRLMQSTDPRFTPQTRIYDIRDLLGPETQSPQWARDGFLSAGYGKLDDAKDLSDLLQIYSYGGDWGDRAFDFGTHRFVNGRYVVVGPWEVHRQVKMVLHELRRPSTPTDGVRHTGAKYAWDPARQTWTPSEPQVLESKLDQPIGTLKLPGVSLEEAVAMWGKAAGISARVDRRDLDRVGFDWRQRVELEADPGPSGDALENLLTRYWLKPDNWLGYRADEGGVVVASRWPSDSGYLRAYDLSNWPPFRDEMNAISNPAQLHLRMKGSDSTHMLAETIKDAVAKQSWREGGGTHTIHAYYGVLLVRQSISGHRAVRKYLAAIRSMDDIVSAATRPAR